MLFSDCESDGNASMIGARGPVSINAAAGWPFLSNVFPHFENLAAELLEVVEREPEGHFNQSLVNVFRIRRPFVIIDEAHNLRDIAGETEDETRLDAPGGLKELAESKAGKLLTPYLRRVLDAADGMKLLLLTATPMYNSYREIIFLFNLLLQNDKKALLSEGMIFSRDGSFTPSGKELLGRAASAYLSFMRGENPLSFPIRLEPQIPDKITVWPSISPDGTPIPKSEEKEREQVVNLPFVPCPFMDTTLADYQRLSQQTIREGGLGLNTVDTMIQAGNWIFPSAS
jgi:hypothetical protein